jgi:hypothetical protein
MTVGSYILLIVVDNVVRLPPYINGLAVVDLCSHETLIAKLAAQQLSSQVSPTFPCL